MKKVILACAAIVMIGAAIVACIGWYAYSNQPLHQLDNGEYRGTGVATYHYADGSLLLEETYKTGELQHSIWYLPDGSIYAEEDWTDGEGTSYYFFDDGTLKASIPSRNGLAEGIGVRYAPDGSVESRPVYRNGVNVGDNP